MGEGHICGGELRPCPRAECTLCGDDAALEPVPVHLTTAATVRIRNLIVAIHEGTKALHVSVWPHDSVNRPEGPIRTLAVFFEEGT